MLATTGSQIWRAVDERTFVRVHKLLCSFGLNLSERLRYAEIIVTEGQPNEYYVRVR